MFDLQQYCRNLWAFMQDSVVQLQLPVLCRKFLEGCIYNIARNTSTVSHFINCFHIAPCTHTYTMNPKAISQHVARVIGKQRGLIFFSISIYLLQQERFEPRFLKNMLPIRDKQYIPSCQIQRNERWRPCWVLELARFKGKQSETHSETVQGWSNITVGEHDRQKCERKWIDFEGKLKIILMSGGKWSK